MRPFFTFVLAMLMFTAVVRAEDFPIKLHRTEKVGDKYHFTAEGSEANTMTLVFAGQAQPARSATSAYKMEAQVEVLEVGKGGGATKVQITIESLAQTAETGDKALAKKGDVLVARTDKATMIFESKEGVKASPAVTKALTLLISLEREGAPDMEQVFGTKDRKKVGDTWPMDTDAAVKTLSAVGLKLEKEKLKGQGKLLAEKTEGGVACLEVQIELTASEIPLPPGALPPGATVKSSSMTMTGTALLPKDQAMRELASTQTMVTKAQMTATIPNAGEVQSDVVNTRTRSVKSTPVK